MDRIGVIKYNMSGMSMEEFLPWCSEKGVEYVELMRPDIWKDTGRKENRVKEVALLLRKYGIKVSQVAAGNDFVQPSPAGIEKELDNIREICRMVKDLGGCQLRLDGGWNKDTVDEKFYKNMVIDGLSRAAEIGEKEGIYMALDNHGKITNDYTLQLEAFGKIGSKYLGANLDTLNYRWYGYPVEKLTDIYRQIAPYTLHTHLKDGVKADTDFKYTPAILGRGEIPLEKTISILKDAGYTGPWCIEYEGKDGAAGYSECIRWLKEIKV